MSNLQNFKPVMQSPLHHFNLPAKAEPMHEKKGVWANEVALLGYISLRGNSQNSAFATAFQQATGSALPTQTCELSYHHWGSVLWLSPDEWLIICKRSLHAELLQKLQTAMQDIHSQVVDNSGGYTAVILRGKEAEQTLQHCTVYDVETLATGRVVGSTFGKSSVILHKLEDGYFLVFRRSFADYIWRYLERSATPYGFGVFTLNSESF